MIRDPLARRRIAAPLNAAGRKIASRTLTDSQWGPYEVYERVKQYEGGLKERLEDRETARAWGEWTVSKGVGLFRSRGRKDRHRSRRPRKQAGAGTRRNSPNGGAGAGQRICPDNALESMPRGSGKMSLNQLIFQRRIQRLVAVDGQSWCALMAARKGFPQL